MKYIDIHTHGESINNEDTFSLVSYRIGVDNINHAVPYMAGVHPWDTQSVDINSIQNEIVNEHNLYAIGEIGLDYSKSKKNKNIQILYFSKQLDVAVSFGRVAFIHSVKAYEDIIPILRGYMSNKLRGFVIHGFIGDENLAKQIIDINGHISINPKSLMSPKTMEAIKSIPLERLFIETDDAETTIIEMYKEIASKLDIDEDLLKETIYNNYINLMEF